MIQAHENLEKHEDAGFGGFSLMDQVKIAGLRILSSGRTEIVPMSLAVDLVIQVCTTERFTGTASTMHLCAHAHPAWLLLKSDCSQQSWAVHPSSHYTLWLLRTSPALPALQAARDLSTASNCCIFG